MPLGFGGGRDQRLQTASGLTLVESDGKIIVDAISFGGVAEKAGIDFDWELKAVEIKNDRMPKEVFYIPAFVRLGLIILLQRRRHRALTAEGGA